MSSKCSGFDIKFDVSIKQVHNENKSQNNRNIYLFHPYVFHSYLFENSRVRLFYAIYSRSITEIDEEQRSDF